MRFVSYPRSRSPSSRMRRILLQALPALCTGLLAAAVPADAMARSIEAFGPDTWARWQTSLKRPAIVVFSTTYCPTCPEAFAYLARAIREHRLGAQLIAVVMDGDGDPRLDMHYQEADRLFVFRGQELALRHTVDPRWRGVTPYVGLFGPTGSPALMAGRPSMDQLLQVLRR